MSMTEIEDIVIEDIPEKVDRRLRTTTKKIEGTQVSRIPGMRKDVKRNLALVSRYLLKNPDASTTQIQKDCKLSYSAVTRARANIAEYIDKDERIIAITERDLEIVWKGQQEIFERMNNPEELAKIKASDLAAIMEKSERRYQLFR